MARDTKARLIETTTRLLQHRGYHGTSLSDIIEASGAPRGSLYFHFPGGKDELVLEATRIAVEETTVELRRAFEAATTPGGGIRLFFEGAADIMEESAYTFGCPIAPVILDANGGSEELAELCREAFEEWIGIMEAAFRAAGIAAKRAHSLALLTESSLEGTLLISRAYTNTEALRAIGTEMETIIDSAVPAPAARKTAAVR